MGRMRCAWVALVAGVAMAATGCGASQPPAPAPQTGGQRPASAQSPPTAAGGYSSAPATVIQGGGPTGAACRSAFFPALQAAAKAALPVGTDETAVTQWHGVGAATFAQTLGVQPTAGTLDAAFASTASAGNSLTVQPKGGQAAWTFTVGAKTAQVTVEEKALGGSALTAAQSFGPAWAGGTVQYQVAFPAGPLGGSPTLAAYLEQLAAAVAAGQADLTVVTGGTPQPAPSQYQAYWGPIQMSTVTAPGSPLALCGSWQGRKAYAYQSGGTLAPVTAEMADIGNGGSVGFGAGRFVVESVHAGVDTYTWYAVPGLPLPPQ